MLPLLIKRMKSIFSYYDESSQAIVNFSLSNKVKLSSNYGFDFRVLYRYYAANTVSLPREVEEIWGCGGALNGGCALQHYCSVTRLDPDSYSNCFQSYAYALSSTSSPSIQIDLVILYQLLAILLTVLQCR